MPIYEYECQKCGQVFEVRQSFRDEPVTACTADNCKGKVKKLFSPPAIIFKGSGFHVNDYGRGNGNGKKSAPKEKDSTACGSCEKAASCPAAAGE
jgi:putative FmdB family regulatory protein